MYYRADCFDEETRLKRCAEDLRKKLQELNDVIVNEVQNHLNAAIENTIAGIRYFRVQPDGPMLKEISERNPLVPRYILPTKIYYHYPGILKNATLL